MKKIVTVIGARPQIIKAAALSRAISEQFSTVLEEIIVHTGQHYDEKMSAVFFDELGIPLPDYNLHVGSSSHGMQTAKMIEGIEEILKKEKPNVLVVYGDTNSTLAAGIAASKIEIPVVHIEAGLRSFNKSMPEEINRILCDHVSTLLFSPTTSGIENLQKEGFALENRPPYSIDNPKVYHVGDIMYDNSLYYAQFSEGYLPDFLTEKKFFLCTVHRGANTDNPEKLSAIFQALLELTEIYAHHIIVLPLHPRTKKCMENLLEKELYEKVLTHPQIKRLPPVSYLQMIALEKNCELVITDSGGVQKEAYFFKKPSIILRPETEWVEIVEEKAAIIADANQKMIIDGVKEMLTENKSTFPSLFGDGKAAHFIAEEIIKHC